VKSSASGSSDGQEKWPLIPSFENPPLSKHPGGGEYHLFKGRRSPSGPEKSTKQMEGRNEACSLMLIGDLQGLFHKRKKIHSWAKEKFRRKEPGGSSLLFSILLQREKK